MCTQITIRGRERARERERGRASEVEPRKYSCLYVTHVMPWRASAVRVWYIPESWNRTEQRASVTSRYIRVGGAVAVQRGRGGSPVHRISNSIVKMRPAMRGVGLSRSKPRLFRGAGVDPREGDAVRGSTWCSSCDARGISVDALSVPKISFGERTANFERKWRSQMRKWLTLEFEQKWWRNYFLN